VVGSDVPISRFEVMFSSDPTAAFANIARGRRPGGRLVFICRQGLVDNKWVTVPAGAAVQHIASDGVRLASRAWLVTARTPR
jgi:hypothetical protein